MADTETSSVPEGVNTEEKITSLWQDYRDKVIKFLQNNNGYQSIMLIILAAGIALLAVSWLWSQGADYQPLYGNQELYDVASVVGVLDQESVDYKIHPSSGQVMVDAGMLSQARMKLSIAGVQARAPEGLEVLDDQDLGSSQFVESVRYRRGLEGELAQTIISLRPVRNARIHLALPKRSSFIRSKEKPSASVFVDLFPGYKLTSNQVEGIINVVATSVANLDRSDVSVIDQNGKLLSSDVLLNDTVLGEVTKQLDFKQQVESGYQQRISNLLEPVVGPSNFRVQVTVNVDFEKVVQTVEQFDPGVGVIRSEQGKEQTSSGGIARGVPGTLSNQPPDDVNVESGDNSSVQSEYVRNYEVDKVVRQVSNQQGRVTRISIAVVFNDKPDEALGIDSWDDARLDSIRRMIIDATGIEESRGDQISIHTAPFVSNVYVTPLPLPWWQQPQTLYYVKYGSGTLLGILILLFLIRPMVKGVSHRLQPSTNQLPEAVEGDINKNKNDSESGDRRVLFDESFNLLPPELADFETQITHMRKLSNKQPERIAQVIKLWMSNYE